MSGGATAGGSWGSWQTVQLGSGKWVTDETTGKPAGRPTVASWQVRQIGPPASRAGPITT